MLYFIGLGLNNEKDISLKGLEIAKKCSKLYLEYYTSKLNCKVEDLENLFEKKIILADRELVEKKAEETILKDAEKEDVAFLVIGDAMSATTHIDLMLRAKEKNIDVKVIHNASVFTAIGVVGLQLYKFGKTTSIPFPQPNFIPKTPYEDLKKNKQNKLHTLFLLDLDPKKEEYMTVKQAIEYLLDQEKIYEEEVINEETLCVGCARLGGDQIIKVGKAKELIEFDFGKPPYCLIIPGELHFKEEEMLELWK